MEKIKDFISGKEVKAGPEEIQGTQPFSKILVQDYGYPKEVIQTRPQYRTPRRPSDEDGSYPVDIAVFKNRSKSDDGLLMIVECKKRDEETGVRELKQYLKLSDAQVGVWYNGIKSRYIHKKIAKNGIVFVELPDIPLFGQGISDIGTQTKKTLKPAKNLKVVFKNVRAHIAGNATGTSRDEPIVSNMINIIFSKIYDERFTEPDALLEFRVSNDESDKEVEKRIKRLFNNVKRKYSDVFTETDEITLDSSTLKYVVGKLQIFSFIDSEKDTVAEAFEGIMGKTLKGEEGQFFTPRNVVALMVRLAGISSDSLVIDPACGTGGFLTEVLKEKWRQIDLKGERLRWSKDTLKDEKNHSAIKTIFGIEKDNFLAKIAKAYMALLGDGRGSIHKDNSLKQPNKWHNKTKTDIQLNKFDFVFTNPPFGEDIKVDSEDILSQYELARGGKNNKLKKEVRPDILFLERCINLAKDGGKVGIVLIETYLHGKNAKPIRDFLSKHNILYVADLPHNTFRPYCNAKTVFVIFQKNVKQQNNINFIVAEQMGHDHNRQPIYKWDENKNTVDKEKLWDDITEVNESIKNNKKDKRVFQINKKIVYAKDISVPRYYWKTREAEVELYCKKRSIDLVSLGQLIDEKILITFDGHGSPASPNKGKGDLSYIRVKDIVNWNIYKDQTASVPRELYQDYVKDDKVLKSEDILFVKRGSYRIGSVAMVSPHDKKMILTKEIQVFRVGKKVNRFNLTSFYLLFCLSSKIVQDQLFNKVLIETILPNISDRWKDLKIPIYKKKIFEDINLRMKKIFVSQKWKSDESIDLMKKDYGNLIT